MTSVTASATPAATPVIAAQPDSSSASPANATVGAAASQGQTTQGPVAKASAGKASATKAANAQDSHAAGTTDQTAQGVKDQRAPNAAALFALLLAAQHGKPAATTSAHPAAAANAHGKKDADNGDSLPHEGDTLPLAALVLVAGLPASEVAAAAKGGGETDGTKTAVQTGDLKLPPGLRSAAELTDSHAGKTQAQGDTSLAATTDAAKGDAVQVDPKQTAHTALTRAQTAALLDATQAQAGQSNHAADPSGQAQQAGVSGIHGAAAGAKPVADARPNLPVLQMQQPMHQPGWDNELGNRVVWMTRNELQGAELRLNPPHLGPLEVKISIHHDSASLSFVAQHVQARDAIEAALPRLREMMAEQGFAKTHVDVSGQSLAQQQQQSTFSSGGGAGNFPQDLLGEDDMLGEHLLGTVQRGVGMVDYFV